MVKLENMNDNGIEVWRIFSPKSVCSCLGPLVGHTDVKGDYHFWSSTGFIRHGAVVCRIVHWKGLIAYIT